MASPSVDHQKAVQENRFAMRLSLIFGFMMLAAKCGAYLLTGSAAIFSDSSESLVHAVAVGFAAFSLSLSMRPATRQFAYGFERISFFSAGFEGALIVLAAFAVLLTAYQQWQSGLVLENLGIGTVLVAGAGIVNGFLGYFLIRRGQKNHSLILEANGRHVLADCWTSIGVVAGLVLVQLTGWKLLDPLVAVAVAVQILWSGSRLVWRSIGGLMDYADPEVGKTLRQELDSVCAELSIEYHGARFRDTGHKLRIELHLLFPFETSLGEAHRMATEVEERLESALEQPSEVITHLESLEDHERVHQSGHLSRLPK
jgi:cation diffusion facilitator family transporter